MSDALADLVAKGDPDRHAATLSAPQSVQSRLWPLYAFHLELGRAAWASREPFVAQMRVQFWADVLDAIGAGAPVPAHEVAGPLALLWREAGLPLALGQQMVAARDWDVSVRRFADDAELIAHFQATTGHLMWLAALALGAETRHETAVRQMALASGLANWLRAVPALRAAGCAPLPNEAPKAIATLAQTGLSALKTARAARGRLPSNLTPVLLTGWQANAILRQAAQDPARVLAGALGQSEFAKRGSLALRALTGRW
jgi:15-cis-phytoene synthase